MAFTWTTWLPVVDILAHTNALGPAVEPASANERSTCRRLEARVFPFCGRPSKRWMRSSPMCQRRSMNWARLASVWPGGSRRKSRSGLGACAAMGRNGVRMKPLPYVRHMVCSLTPPAFGFLAPVGTLVHLETTRPSTLPSRCRHRRPFNTGSFSYSGRWSPCRVGCSALDSAPSHSTLHI